MASPKVGYGLPARPSDGLRRRPEDSRLLSGIPKSTSRTTERETEVPKLVKKESSQPRVASRVPLPSSARRPSPSTTQQSGPKAIPDRHSKSWGSATSSSGYSRSHTQTESGSSSSSRSFDSSTRLGQNVPRRTKPSPSPEAGSLLNGAPNLGSNSSRHQSQGSVDSALGIQFDRGITASPSAIQREEPAEVSKAVGQSPVIYPELDRYRHHDRARSTSNRPAIDMPYRLATHDLPPPTPGSLLFSANSSQVSAISGSPSTRFSTSPGPGPYSRDTTPTSISSQSPGLIAPSRAFPMNKFRQHSPAFTRPPVTRRRTGSISNEVDSISVDPHGLAAVRESLTSSSSSSTVKGSVINPKKERRGGKSLAAPPPSPPPRKSSQSSQKPFISEDEDELSPRQKRQPGSQPMAVSSPPRSGLPLRNYQSPSPQAMPPRRPSRDGTSDLKSQLFTPIPVIQSSLALRANFERRDSEATIPPPSQTIGLQSNKSASTSNLPTAEQPATSSKLAGRRKLSISGPVRASGTPSPTVKASSGSRFPFFGRKKAASESTANDKDKKEKQKVSRKGPAAGTGHEGYGRLGAIRRRSGIVAAPQVSNESLASGDSFLADRINPVIIAGGAIVENRNASAELIRSESNLSLTTDDRPSIDSIANSTTSSAPRGVSGPSLWPSAIPRERNQMPSARRPSDSSDTGGAPIQSTLAYRRSVQRLKSFPDDPLQLPRPINTSGVITSPLTSFDTSIMSDESSLFNLQQLPSQDLINNNHPAPKKLKKKPRSPRKWNFFSRSNNQPKSEKASEPVAVTVQPVEKKPVAFYTIMDSPEQGVAEPDLKEILREADAYARSPANVDTPEVQAEEAHAVNGSSLQPQSNILPEPLSPVQDPYPALIEPAFPQMEGIPPPAVTLSSGRPSRLAQVGRIPQVVSNRPARPSPRSFSRPFVANQQLSLHIPQTHGVGLNPRVPNFSKPATPVPDASGGDGSTTDAGTEFSFFSEPRSHITPKDTATQEFLAFSPRKNSDCTTSSTESCVSYNYAEATAIIPKPGDPPVDDEVWDEYDDLLGEETVKERQSTTSSRGIPFHLENYHLKLAKEKALESPTLVTDGRKLSTISDAPTASTTFSADMTERIRKAFQPHPSPTVPSPVPEVPEQKDGGHSRKPSATESMRHSITSIRKSTQSGSSTSSGEWTPLAQVNLRVGSMTVSKWLSFGQVLFSDIRHLLVKGIESPERPSVLVIDGLGNDDWSFYAAETYSTADFFNLSPRAPLPTDVESSASRYPLGPPNHHQVQYLSQLDEFPFPTHTFNCVVYRFPAAAPESHYQNVLSEARRVLKPGGYLELSILDVDLNNMGNRGRRTIRQLKERIHESSPETNLASTADLIVRLLGKSGFSTIKAARVGVPVASSITSSDDNSQSHGLAENKKKRSSKNQPSLAEMMRDHSPNADEGITNMVSRVGRWWYSRCYENATSHSSGKNSIWNDKALLRECEELGTSLKLMVCCARAPEGINAV
ncbi:hypothetical protein BBK36DRAFT_1182108 [Trichoderma citrinoviride]|uniref:Methyltransferase type 11 domain-containing protein n=1 Tax=Trichoderma citrinoviride TaxID=58853 RepID=A0A2T4B2E6_9HYPO|nr:hypothetical protein BBK36DRAFT_1182108 [Trichoderma citrinoviride]PTB63503.1 hypothetical protein BBK36DRAFT_1182108 [Trichoderma citrinoviride]